MFILFHASSSHPPLTTTSSSFRVRSKGKVNVELEKKEKKKNHRYLVPPFSGVGSSGVRRLDAPLRRKPVLSQGILVVSFFFF